MFYKALTTDDLARLQKGLGYTGSQMAKFLGISNDKQYRKYTGGKKPRIVSMHMLFWAMAHQVLKQKDIETVYDAMREAGAVLDPNAEAAREQDGEQGSSQD